MQQIMVTTHVQAPIPIVWERWNLPLHMMHWNQASPDWQTTYAENDLRTGGKFCARMEAKDGSFGFDFGGTYDEVIPHERIKYTMDDGRKVTTTFTVHADKGVTVTNVFDAETQNPLEMQRGGWQAILDNFKSYAEKNINNTPLHFEIEIQAPVEKVYETMLHDKTYREWTSIFNATSHFKGSWNKNEKILFIGTDADGKEGGMMSRIKENIPFKFVSIEHLGMINGEEEITPDEAVDSWAGALENYSFHSLHTGTLLQVDTDCNENYKNYFMETWPKALHKLKSICEN